MNNVEPSSGIAKPVYGECSIFDDCVTVDRYCTLTFSGGRTRLYHIHLLNRHRRLA